MYSKLEYIYALVSYYLYPLYYHIICQYIYLFIFVFSQWYVIVTYRKASKYISLLYIICSFSLIIISKTIVAIACYCCCTASLE